MQDSKYCYPDSNVLINKLNIREGDAGAEEDQEQRYRVVTGRWQHGDDGVRR